MNTTELIRHWKVKGAAPDLSEQFRSIAATLDPSVDGEPRPADAVDALRMRSSDEEEWRPLLLLSSYVREPLVTMSRSAPSTQSGTSGPPNVMDPPGCG